MADPIRPIRPDHWPLLRWLHGLVETQQLATACQVTMDHAAALLLHRHCPGLLFPLDQLLLDETDLASCFPIPPVPQSLQHHLAVHAVFHEP